MTTKDKVLLAGRPGDPGYRWLVSLLDRHGYQVVHAEPAAAVGPVQPVTLATFVAAIDLGRGSGDDRLQALANLDERLAPSRPLLASCSSVPIDELASYTARPERVVGLSAFGPRHDDMLVELVPGLGTESRLVRQAAELLATLGLRTATLPPGSWAVYPRVLSMIVNEAAVAIAEGVATAADIDRAMMLGASYPRGPVALADEIGLDEVLAVLDALYAELGDDRYRAAPLLRHLVRAGFTGRAAGRGFHLYP